MEPSLAELLQLLPTLQNHIRLEGEARRDAEARNQRLEVRVSQLENSMLDMSRKIAEMTDVLMRNASPSPATVVKLHEESTNSSLESSGAHELPHREKVEHSLPIEPGPTPIPQEQPHQPHQPSDSSSLDRTLARNESATDTPENERILSPAPSTPPSKVHTPPEEYSPTRLIPWPMVFKTNLPGVLSAMKQKDKELLETMTADYIKKETGLDATLQPLPNGKVAKVCVPFYLTSHYIGCVRKWMESGAFRSITLDDPAPKETHREAWEKQRVRRKRNDPKDTASSSSTTEAIQHDPFLEGRKGLHEENEAVYGDVPLFLQTSEILSKDITPEEPRLKRSADVEPDDHSKRARTFVGESYHQPAHGGSHPNGYNTFALSTPLGSSSFQHIQTSVLPSAGASVAAESGLRYDSCLMSGTGALTPHKTLSISAEGSLMGAGIAKKYHLGAIKTPSITTSIRSALPDMASVTSVPSPFTTAEVTSLIGSPNPTSNPVEKARPEMTMVENLDSEVKTTLSHMASSPRGNKTQFVTVLQSYQSILSFHFRGWQRWPTQVEKAELKRDVVVWMQSCMSKEEFDVAWVRIASGELKRAIPPHLIGPFLKKFSGRMEEWKKRSHAK
ncbi:hypothetical protein HDU67_002635 [Dinochytrium kinnereticum]|nr:hypothetical protein HDU67_002635 [Dinochytrium kinnereticum]